MARPLPSAPPRALRALALALLLAGVGCTSFSRAVKEGDRAAEAQDWAAADAAYARALTVSPGDSEVTLKRRQVRQRWSAQVLSQAEAAGDKLEDAQRLAQRALELDADNAEARALLVRTLGARVARGQKALAAERLGDASADFDGVLAVDPKNPGAVAGRNGVMAAWARRWYGTGQDFERRGLLGNALLAYLRADQERVGATPARERAEAVRRALRDEVAFEVRATPPVDRSGAPDVAQRLAAGRLAAMLPPVLPIRVLPVPAEAPPTVPVAVPVAGKEGRTAAAAPQGPTAQAPRGVQVGLVLERVLTLNDVVPSQRTKRYVATMRSVPNPKRVQNEGKLLDTERSLEDAQRKQSTVMRDYLRLQAELSAARQVEGRCRDAAAQACRDVMEDCQKASAQVQAEAQSRAAEVQREAERARAQAQQEGAKGEGGVDPKRVLELTREVQERAARAVRECEAGRCAKADCAREAKALADKEAQAREVQRELEFALDGEEVKRREVQRGRDATFREPLTVDEPVYADYVYDVETHRLTVRATVTLSVAELGREGPAQPHTQDFDAVHEDVSHKGYEKYGILADPVQLRPEPELRTEVGDKAVAELARRVKERFDAYRKVRVEDARRSAVRAGEEDAVETTVRALLLSADAPPEDLLRPLAQARGLTQPEAIFALGGAAAPR